MSGSSVGSWCDLTCALDLSILGSGSLGSDAPALMMGGGARPCCGIAFGSVGPSERAVATTWL